MLSTRKTKRRSLLLASASLVAGIALTSTASAQDSQSDEEVEEVVVTGSRIKRADLSAVSPVSVVSDIDLRLSGNVNIDRTLNELPAVTPSATTTTNNGGSGIATVDLRELRPERTLVLQNGRRMIGSNTLLQVDLNNIPSVLVDRVEVLTGGASAIYGSDAVAGVVNFILKDDFEGLEMGGQYTISERGDGDIRSVDLTLGGNFADDRGNAVFSIAYTDRKSVIQGNRPWARDAIADFGTGEFIAFGSSRLEGGRAAGGVPIDVDGDGDLESTLGFNPDGTVRDAGGESFNFAPFQFMQTPQKRITLTTIAHYDLNEDHRMYFEGLYSNNRVDLQLAPDANDIPDLGALLVPNTNPLIPSDVMAALLASFDTGLNGDEVAGDGIATIPDFRRRMTDVGGRSSLRDFDLYRFVVGFDGKLSEEWDYDLSYSHARVNRSFTLLGRTSDARIQQALDASVDANGNPVCNNDPLGICVPINIFGNGNISPEGAAFISPTAEQVSTNEQNIFSANISGTFENLDLGAGPVGMAFGGEYREEVAQFLPDAVSQSGELGPGNSSLPTEGNFDVWEVYGEALIPLIGGDDGGQSLDLELAARISDYSTVGGIFTWSGGLQWQPIEDVRIRGGFQRAIRAPNISELFAGQSAGSASTTDPCSSNRVAPEFVDVCIASGAPAGYLQTDPQAFNISSGNANLSEETSDTFTIGAVITPEAVPGLAITVDYYNIKIDDAISVLTTSSVLDLCLRSQDANSSFCNRITRDGTGRLVSVLSSTENIAQEKREGIDWQISYAFGLGDGELTLQNIGNYSLTNEFTSTPFADPTDCNGIFGGGCTGLGDFTAAKYRITQNATYNIEDWTFRLQGRLISPIDNADRLADRADGGDANFAQGKIKANVYMDFTFDYNLNENVSISGGVENLTDNSPPIYGFFNNVAANTDPSLYDVIGRSYFMGARLRF